jgi:hypothetical protein
VTAARDEVEGVARGLTKGQISALWTVDRWMGVTSKDRYHCLTLVQLGVLGTRKEGSRRYFWPTSLAMEIRAHLERQSHVG